MHGNSGFHAASQLDFAEAHNWILAGLASSSKRKYAAVLDRWQRFARAAGIDAFDLDFDALNRFLDIHCHSKSSLKLYKAALGHLCDWADFETGDSWYTRQRKLMARLPRQPRRASSKRQRRRALSSQEAQLLHDVWRDRHDQLGVRNRAIVRTLLHTGMRRAEAAGLECRDVMADSAQLVIRQGKGGRQRVVYVADASGETKQDLAQLAAAGEASGARSLFGVSLDTIYRVTIQAGMLAGVGAISPHDLRRTHITLALRKGASVADMQAQAGHRDGNMTLRYSIDDEASARGQRIMRALFT